MKPRHYEITPVPKPRMTQRDKWQQRPSVVRYRAFKDEVRLRGLRVPEAGAQVVFVMPMPQSWRKTKRGLMNGQPHQQKPDVDNLLKGLLDAIYTDDCTVYDVRVSKIWGLAGEIIVAEGEAE